MAKEYNVTCADAAMYGNLKAGRWPWYIRVTLFFCPMRVEMDDFGVFGFKYKRLFGKTYIIKEICNR